MDQKEFFYTRLSQAFKELKSRSKDKALVDKIRKNMGSAYPDWLPDKPCLFFSRNIITPNIETLYFLDIARDSGFEVIFFEYHDKFVSRNKSKYYLGNICTNFPEQRKKKIIVDFQKYEGKTINNVQTNTGSSLLDYHHDLSRKIIKDFDSYKIIDITKWFNDTRNVNAYYFNYFSLFITNGILFENFLLDDEEEKVFLEKKFIPSVKKIKEVYGINPLIYPLLPFESQADNSWFFYPKEVYNYITND